jgi:hypothetical protein
MAEQNELKIAKANLDKAQKLVDALLIRLGDAVPNSKKYLEIQTEYEAAKKVRNAEEKKYNKVKDVASEQEKTFQQKQANIDSQQKRVDQRIELLESNFSRINSEYKKDPNDQGKSNSLLTAISQLDDAYTDFVSEGFKVVPKFVKQPNGTFVPVVAKTPAVAAAATGGVKVLGREQRGESVKAIPTGLSDEKPSGEIDKIVTPVKITKAAVTAELDALGLIDTPDNRLKARESLKNKKTAPAEDTAWEAIFKQSYPQYNWMFTDLDRTKYADVFDLFKRAQQNTMLPEEFDRQYIGTSFYRELQSGKKGRELSAAIGNFTWGSGNLAKFLTTATQYGYEGENLKQQAYKELFTKVDNKYVNFNAVDEVRKSTPYLGLKDIGKQYFLDIADSQVEQVLSGVPNFDGVALNRDDLIRKARLAAKATYGHLSEQIDAGLTLEELSASYKEKAARVLELDPNTMNFGADFSEALNYRKDGQPRVLSLGEWETELRTNDKYKYSFTKQANQDATDIGLAIARAFGKVQ